MLGADACERIRVLGKHVVGIYRTNGGGIVAGKDE